LTYLQSRTVTVDPAAQGDDVGQTAREALMLGSITFVLLALVAPCRVVKQRGGTIIDD
jgi:hypothetical protein